MKVTGTYTSVIGGVSELPPSARLPGQCGEQVNFLSDRTVGLARRPGSLLLGERAVGAQPSASHTDGNNWRVVPWQQAGGDYSALVRTHPRTTGCNLPGLQVFSHESESFLPIVRGTDPDLDVLFDGGCTSAASTGAYLFMAGQNTVPTATSTDTVLDPAFVSKSSVWIRGGAFDREYAVEAVTPAGTVAARYKTPGADYPGALDTSNIPWYAPDPAGGTESVSYTGGVLAAPGSGVIYVPVWGEVLSNIRVWDADGVELTRTSFPVPTSASQFYSPVTTGYFQELMPITLYAGAVGHEYRVQVDHRPAFMAPGTETTTSVVRLADIGVEVGYFYLASPFVSGVTCPGFTLVSGQLPEPGEFAYGYGSSPNYVYFNAQEIGEQVTISGLRAKVITNPDYQRLVDDAKLAYDRAVTAYVIAAAVKIAPEYIASQLASSLTALGVTTAVFGNHLALSNALSVTATDGGDGSLIRAVDTEVPSVDALTDKHYVGKVVRIRPVSGSDGYYVKGTRKGTYDGAFGEVLWVEAAGIEHKIQHAFCYATLSGGSCYVASSATLLATLLPGTHPEFPTSTAGDAISAPLPAFVGKRITLLTTFQNRLIVGTGGTLSISRTGDYLAFHPRSVLTVPSDDAFEVTAQGSDTDVLRQAVLYGRDLLLFGDNRQYAISGKEALTPTGISLAVVSTVSSAASVQPQAIGGYLFFATTGERGTAVAQLQPSLDPNNPQVIPVSEHLTSYLAGAPVEAARRGNPDTLYLRTAEAQGSIFQYRFSDSQRGREHSSWSKWEFNPALGTVLGMRATGRGLVVFFLRDAHGDTFLVADLCGEQAALSTRPYLDSQRPLAAVLAGTGSVRVTSPDTWVAAYTSSSVRFLIGDSISGLTQLRALYGDTHLVIGAEQPARWELTAPVIRDREGRVNRSGRLTVNSVQVHAGSSSGLEATLATQATSSTRGFLARRAGDTTLIGRIPVVDWTQQLAVGKNSEAYTLTVSPKKWYPLTITGVEWTGQLFSRAQRV